MPPAVTLEAVTVGYPGRIVLESVDAALPAGRATAIVGPNGSGKSTLLDAIAGVRPVLSGSVTRTCRERPAYVTQRSELTDTVPLTVGATVAMGRWAHRGPWRRLTAGDRDVVARCLRRLDLTPLEDRPVGSLSGGQRQRTLLAQGLAQQSDLLLLDEPETGLDRGAKELIEHALDEERAAGTSVVRVTHDRDVALRSDHCLVLDRGLLVVADVPVVALRAGDPPTTDASGLASPTWTGARRRAGAAPSDTPGR